MKTYRSTKDIAATIREALKRELPKYKFSVTVEYFSGGSAINLALMSGPKQVLANGKGYEQLNEYTLMDPSRRMPDYGPQLTKEGERVMRKACELLSAEHWDKSEPMIDYFCTNFYKHVAVGKWNRPYEVKP